MGVSGTCGAMPWACKEFSEAVGVTPTAASRKAQAFERQVLEVLRGLAAIDGRLRPCDAAEMVLATMRTGGRLQRADEDAMRGWLRTMAEAVAKENS